MERLLLRKITHPQEDVSDNGRDLIQVRRNTNARVVACPKDKEIESRETDSMPIYIFPGLVQQYLHASHNEDYLLGDILTQSKG